MEETKLKKVYCHNCKCDTEQEMMFRDSTIDVGEIIGFNEEGIKGSNFFTHSISLLLSVLRLKIPFSFH